MRKANYDSGPYLSDVISLTTAGANSSAGWWEQFQRPDCTLRVDESHERPRDLDSWTLVSLYGPKPLLLELSQKTDLSDDRIDAVKEILSMGDVSRIPLLIRYKQGEDLQKAMNLFAVVLRRWSDQRLTEHRRKGLNVVFDYMEGAFPIMVDQQWGNEVLCWASEYGCLPFLERLFAAAARHPALKREILRTFHRGKGNSQWRHQSVGDAAWNGQYKAVAFLLRQDGIEAHLRYTDRKGNNVFHQAVRFVTPDIISLLLTAFLEGVDQQDDNKDTPLRKLLFGRPSKQYGLTMLLLQVGHADVGCGYREYLANYHEPLPVAARLSDLEMCELLLKMGGAKPREVSEDSGTESTSRTSELAMT